ncbi:uncharacterized protein LOC133516317 [Cydia pomonella]|uniref:uncharacterized protein LOC133516317 n=1 Tax=Cydia pomonella TaxID=82600 RepID=UPI002ADE89E0|nr:uncharacterized protein LOC133516317 [Cydia pomonella]
MYSTYSHILHALAAVLSISILSKRWGLDDSVLCLISFTSKLVGFVYINFVQTDFQMYLVPIVQFLNATTYTSLRSMSSKLVPSEELGKMNSLFSLVETLAALVFDPVYATIYAQTMKQFTSAVYVFSGGMAMPAIIILMYVSVNIIIFPFICTSVP